MNQPNAILIVDDDTDLCSAFSAVLQTAGYATLCANTADEALHLAAQNKISVILTDLNLPQGNGLDLLQQLKAAGHPIPAILFTGADEFTHADARRTGVAAFLVKPVGPAELLRVLAAVLAQNNLALK